jgi:hypothetical protein
MEAAIFLIIGLAAWASYCVYVAKNFGIKQSVSVMYYDLEQKDEWLFVAAIIIFSFFSMFGAGLMGYWWFMAAAFLMTLIGVGANYTKRDGKRTPSKHAYAGHMIGSYGCVLLGTASIWIDLGYIALSLIGFAVLAYLQIWGDWRRTTYQEWFASGYCVLIILYSICLG